jgi:hypothetical protein
MKPSIDDVRALGEVHSLYRWNMYFITFPSAVAAPPTREEMNRRCATTTRPKVTFNDTLVNMRGHTVEQQGKMTYERRITLQMLETVDVKVAQFLSDWRQAAWQDGTGVSADKKDLEASIKLELLDNQDNPTWEYVLTGVILKDMTLMQLLEESDEIDRPEIILGYDFYRDGPPNTVTGSNVIA